MVKLQGLPSDYRNDDGSPMYSPYHRGKVRSTSVSQRPAISKSFQSKSPRAFPPNAHSGVESGDDEEGANVDLFQRLKKVGKVPYARRQEVESGDDEESNDDGGGPSHITTRLARNRALSEAHAAKMGYPRISYKISITGTGGACCQSSKSENAHYQTKGAMRLARYSGRRRDFSLCLSHIGSNVASDVFKRNLESWTNVDGYDDLPKPARKTFRHFMGMRKMKVKIPVELSDISFNQPPKGPSSPLKRVSNKSRAIIPNRRLDDFTEAEAGFDEKCEAMNRLFQIEKTQKEAGFISSDVEKERDSICTMLKTRPPRSKFMNPNYSAD